MLNDGNELHDNRRVTNSGGGRGRGRHMNDNRKKSTTCTEDKLNENNKLGQKSQQKQQNTSSSSSLHSSGTTKNICNHIRRQRGQGDTSNSTTIQQQQRLPNLNEQQSNERRRNTLLLHGNRQTGQILLGRIEKLRKRLLNDYNIGIIAPDAPFDYNGNNVVTNPTTNDNNNNNTNNKINDNRNDHQQQRIEKTWWKHTNNYQSKNKNDWYIGYEQSIQYLQNIWNEYELINNPFIGIIGFSQGAQLAHFLTIYSDNNNNNNVLSKNNMFKGCQFTIIVAIPSYTIDIPLPPLPIFLSLSTENNVQHQQQQQQQQQSTMIDKKEQLFLNESTVSSIPTLHIWGNSDQLVTPIDSMYVMEHYFTTPSLTECHVHDGGHYVPMKEPDVKVILNFIEKYYCNVAKSNSDNQAIRIDQVVSSIQPSHPLIRSTTKNDEETVNIVEDEQLDSILLTPTTTPDEGNAQAQQDEIEALQAIYPDEITMISIVAISDNTDEVVSKYDYPIRYRFQIHPSDDTEKDIIKKLWPPHPIAIEIEYPYNYPSDSIPIIHTDIGKNNGIQFTSTQGTEFRNRMITAANDEYSMPCALSIIYAAIEFFQDGQFNSIQQSNHNDDSIVQPQSMAVEYDSHTVIPTIDSSKKNTIQPIRSVSDERKQQCILEGLEIANRLLHQETQSQSDDTNGIVSTSNTKGGSWAFTIGLVGKPSAGKSTFFNAATAFARQRRKEGDDDNVAGNNTNNKATTSEHDAATSMAQRQLGGASMAPHPFTTIDPNIGYCLVPAPIGSCPEETMCEPEGIYFGSTHGRDNNGRRLIPVLLKDVAGLVPGAYEGRGRGNQFLNDLCDTDVLIHVVDSSGMSDTEGNIVGVINSNTDTINHDIEIVSHPLNDMSWIRNELVQWVLTNLMYKWDTIRRKGRSKLSDMFSGYGQPQSTTWNVLDAVEIFLEVNEKRDRSLDNLMEWDEGDVARLVSTFLAVRFPIALALNKCDLPTSQKHISDILSSLPIHGTLVGTPISAKEEMLFMKYHIEKELGIDKLLHDKDVDSTTTTNTTTKNNNIPSGTWQCLQSALSMRDVVLVFPVSDFVHYNPLPGLTKTMINDSSLPTPSMIACLEAAGGSSPTLWDPVLKQYTAPSTKGSTNDSTESITSSSLRDAILMKGGSTVEDVFITLKRMGGVSGEFVRAEGTSDIGISAKPIPKTTIISKKVRILKIMTNKRSSWQK